MYKTVAHIVALFVFVPALSLQAQTLRSPRHSQTPAQVELLGQLQGVGALKFGAKLESFDVGALKPLGANVPSPSPAFKTFEYQNDSKLSWGTLHPTLVEVEFCYDQLVGIRLLFNAETSDLLAVHEAACQKYGYSTGHGDLAFFDGKSMSCQVWDSDTIQMMLSLPTDVPLEADADFLHRKIDGAVGFFDHKLSNDLLQQNAAAQQAEMLKTHDLEKIKADL
jgi:hypothetical protein